MACFELSLNLLEQKSYLEFIFKLANVKRVGSLFKINKLGKSLWCQVNIRLLTVPVYLVGREKQDFMMSPIVKVHSSTSVVLVAGTTKGLFFASITLQSFVLAWECKFSLFKKWTQKKTYKLTSWYWSALMICSTWKFKIILYPDDEFFSSSKMHSHLT